MHKDEDEGRTHCCVHSAALRVAAADRDGKFAPRSLVTRVGELFKADGEVVSSSGDRPGMLPYLLICDPAPSSGARGNVPEWGAVTCSLFPIRGMLVLSVMAYCRLDMLRSTLTHLRYRV